MRSKSAKTDNSLVVAQRLGISSVCVQGQLTSTRFWEEVNLVKRAFPHARQITKPARRRGERKCSQSLIFCSTAGRIPSALEPWVSNMPNLHGSQHVGLIWTALLGF